MGICMKKSLFCLSLFIILVSFMGCDFFQDIDDVYIPKDPNENTFKGIMEIDQDTGTYYVVQDRDLHDGTMLLKTKNFREMTYLHTFDDYIEDVRLLEDGELLVTVGSGYEFDNPWHSIELDIDEWGTDARYGHAANLCYEPHHVIDTDSDGIADGLDSHDIGSCSVDGEGQHFTANALWGHMSKDVEVIPDHIYYVAVMVDSEQELNPGYEYVYLQTTTDPDDIKSYQYTFLSTEGRQILGQEVTAVTNSLDIQVVNRAGEGWGEITWEGTLVVDVTAVYPDGKAPSLEEFLDFCERGVCGETGLWKSSGGQRSWEQVLEYTSYHVQPMPEWGLSVSGEHLVFSEYGVIDYNNTTDWVPLHTWSRKVYYSDDYGESWEEIFDVWDAPDGYFPDDEAWKGCHIHGCLYDPYGIDGNPRIWITTGDNEGSRTIGWTDDHGETWDHIETSSYTPTGGVTGITQSLSFFAMPDCILLTHDSTVNQGVYRIDREACAEDGYPTLELVYEFEFDDQPYAPVNFGMRMIQPTETSPVFIPFARAGISTEDYRTGQSFVLSTRDGETFEEVWRNSYISRCTPAIQDMYMKFRVYGKRYFIDIGDDKHADRKSHYTGILLDY